ncbi:hypothetical protein [Rhodanobacter lindaniclasticus]|uniref:hypothetical protein n=1 Tax=Rhodanobacter lindaniclasticus TaxID=75310 RepID=UPI0010A0823B|nr:hypothetical protein [Rhodanobacter lindaniclasticus]
MSERTVFLVYGFDCYEYPYDPIKAFASEADAQALLAEIAAYQTIKPAYPGDSASDEEFDAWEKAYDEWRSAHPAGDANGHDGFNVMPLQLDEGATP